MKITPIALVVVTAALVLLAGCQKEQVRQEPGTELDRIEVTGSRIKHADIESASPVFVIDREAGGRVAMRIQPKAIEQLKVVNDQAYAAMFFDHYGVNPTIDTAEEPISTFAADVDRGSFSVARAYLERGNLPPEAAIRVEEFVNAFDYGYPAPADEDFALVAEAFPSPNRPGYQLLHLGVKGRDVAVADRLPANLVFVIDVSGSMGMENRLGLVKRSLSLLVDQMREDDSVGIVVYGTDARVVLPPTAGSARATIREAIRQLGTEGATNAAAGVTLGYRIAGHNFSPDTINRIILCSDGVANAGPTTGAEGILSLIGSEARRGIHLTTIGFGMGNYNDVLMEQLAQHGGGNYYYVDDEDEARRVFVENLTGTLQVIAEDVKIQVAFDPEVVSRYRLLGFENRHLETEDFDNDQVDAGEIGAGHTVTALYEVKVEQPGRDLGWFRLRYKQPGDAQSWLMERALTGDIVRSSMAQASPPARLSLAVSMLAEKLRGSYWVRNVSYDDIDQLLKGLPDGVRRSTAVDDFTTMLATAHQLDQREDRFATIPAGSNFDRVPVLR